MHFRVIEQMRSRRELDPIPTSVRMLQAILLLLIACSPIANAQWSSDPHINNPICTVTGIQYPPKLISDGVGGTIMLWTDYRDGGTSSDIYAQKTNAMGVVQWTTNGIAVCSAVSRQSDPAAVSDNCGGAIIVWNDFRNGSHGDIYAQRINAEGVVQWGSDVVISIAHEGQATPKIISDDAGGAIIIWVDWRNYDWDIYAQRVSGAGVVQWSDDGIPICTSSGNQGGVNDMVSDGSGGAIITWEDWRNGPSDIYAQRINSSGVPQWTPNGIPICAAASSQGQPVAIGDSSGGAYIAWHDDRGDSTRVYAQRVNGSGVAQWTTDGICMSTSGRSLGITITSTTGGAIISWADNRAIYVHIYAQRINSTGVPQWSPGGVPICTTQHYREGPHTIPDGTGGAIIVWGDKRSGCYDIFGQRIDASGICQWISNGAIICSADTNQTAPAVESDGAGGAIVAWQDYRNFDYDIYAQRVFTNGTLPVQLASFTATALANNIVRLEWRTVSEVNNYGFFVERRAAGLEQWMEMPNSFVAGHGTTSEPQSYSYTDVNAPLTPLQYRLKQVDLDGPIHFSEPINVSTATNVNETAPGEFTLEQNFPNPFNPSTEIRFSVGLFARTSLKIFDMLGMEVGTLFDDVAEAGRHYSVRVDGRNLSSGIYFYRLQSGKKSALKKLVIIK